MATYNKYSNSQGEFWQVRGYLGVNEETGEKVECRKRGFQTKKKRPPTIKKNKRSSLQVIASNKTNDILLKNYIMNGQVFIKMTLK